MKHLLLSTRLSDSLVKIRLMGFEPTTKNMVDVVPSDIRPIMGIRKTGDKRRGTFRFAAGGI
jgi:hypothetical protein